MSGTRHRNVQRRNRFIRHALAASIVGSLCGLSGCEFPKKEPFDQSGRMLQFDDVNSEAEYQQRMDEWAERGDRIR